VRSLTRLLRACHGLAAATLRRRLISSDIGCKLPNHFRISPFAPRIGAPADQPQPIGTIGPPQAAFERVLRFVVLRRTLPGLPGTLLVTGWKGVFQPWP